MTVIDTLTDFMADHGPALVHTIIKHFIAMAFHYCFKRWRQRSRAGTENRLPTANTPEDGTPPPRQPS